jgi:hypothetical protein
VAGLSVDLALVDGVAGGLADRRMAFLAACVHRAGLQAGVPGDAVAVNFPDAVAAHALHAPAEVHVELDILRVLRVALLTRFFRSGLRQGMSGLPLGVLPVAGIAVPDVALGLEATEFGC